MDDNEYRPKSIPNPADPHFISAEELKSGIESLEDGDINNAVHCIGTASRFT